MRNDLTNGKDKIERSARDEAIYLRGPRIVELAFRLFLDEFGRNFAKSFYIGTPVMNLKKILRNVSEHLRELAGRHRRVCAEGGKNCLQAVTVMLPAIAG